VRLEQGKVEQKVEDEALQKMLQKGYPKNYLSEERTKRQKKSTEATHDRQNTSDFKPFRFGNNDKSSSGSKQRGTKSLTSAATPTTTSTAASMRRSSAATSDVTATKQPMQDVFLFGGRQPDIKKMKSGTRYITKSTKKSVSKHLIGARAYYTETLRDPYIAGLELLYSDGSSTKCGDCSLKRMSDAMMFGDDEHIIGIDFMHGIAGTRNKLIQLCLYTSHPRGRRVVFYFRGEREQDDKAEEFYADCCWGGHLSIGSCKRDDDVYLPFIGVYDHIVGKVGKDFTCKRGHRVTGIEFNCGKIVMMTQERIPNDQNRKWWKKSFGYEPNEHLRLEAKKAKEEYSYLIGVQACYVEGEYRHSPPIIVGLKLRYSNGEIARWGKTKKKKKSEEFPFEKDEHIIGIDFHSNEDGITSLKLYTSNFGGRTADFSKSYRGGISADEDGGDYVGLYSELGDEFICGRGNRVTGITFKHKTITSMDEDPIPTGQNERWWERSFDYSSESDPSKVEERRISRAKWQKDEAKSDTHSDEDDTEYVCDSDDGKEEESSTSSNESSDSHFDQAEVDNQQQVVMDDYEPEYEGNYHSHSGGWDDRSNYGFDGGCYGFSARDCDDLLDQGIKPWEDDAGAALGAMRGW